MTDLFAERRACPSLPESIGLLEANARIMHKNMESCREEVMARLDAHSEIIDRINKEFGLVNATLGALARNIATESKLRREAAERSAEMHESLMTAIQQVIATQGAAQMAFQDMAKRQATLEEKRVDDIERGSSALSAHAESESALIRIVIYLGSAVIMLLVWFHPWFAWLKELLPVDK